MRSWRANWSLLKGMRIRRLQWRAGSAEGTRGLLRGGSRGFGGDRLGREGVEPGAGVVAAALLQRGAEAVGEVGEEAGRRLVPAHRPAELPLERGDAPVGDAAGDDEVEPAEVGVEVEGEAVHADPAAAADAEGAHLPLVAPAVGPDPDAGAALDAAGGEPVVGAGPHDGLLELAEEAVDVRAAPAVGVAEAVEVEDGGGDELSGAVERDGAGADDRHVLGAAGGAGGLEAAEGRRGPELADRDRKGDAW